MAKRAAATISAPAKVNLYLHVGPVRADGRHPLDSLVVFADSRAADRISYTPSDAPVSMRVTGPGAQNAMLGSNEDNLILRAARLLADHSGRAITGELTLEKHLPIAAGIGGGSSDAAATLRLLNIAMNLGYSIEDLMALSVPLGGDVPACVAGEPVLMRGDGDRIEPIAETLPALPALLVTPPIACPTGPVFRAFDGLETPPAFEEIPPPSSVNSAGAFLGALKTGYRNDLQAPAVSLHPEIHDLLDVLSAFEGAEFFAMSGSGATCFAIFADETQLAQAAAALREQSPAFWVSETKLGRAGFDLSF